MHLIAAALLAMLSLFPAASHGQQRLVFAHYTGWSQERLPPEDIDFGVVTHLLHFSCKPRNDGSLNFTQHQLRPDHIAATIAAAHSHVPPRPVLLTVGGASTAAQFVNAPRDTLVGNIVSAVAQHDYDGVMIDWEPPRDGDGAAMQAFIASLRAALPRSQMLTMDVGYNWGTKGRHNVAANVAGIIQNLNYIHLMAYALAGPWPEWVAWHNSALFNGGRTLPGGDNPLPSAQVMVEQYISAGVPASKITLGLAFFGHVWTGVFAPMQSWPPASPPTKTGEYQYWRLFADFPTAARRWDSVSKTPYLSLNAAGIANDKFVPYENQQSIRAKKAYAIQRGLGGLMIWELQGDLMPNGTHPLFNALRTR